MAENPIDKALGRKRRSRRGGGGSGNPIDNALGRRQVATAQARANAALDNQRPQGGIGGFFREAGGIIKSTPSGLGHLVVDAATEAARAPQRISTGATMLSHGDPRGLGYAFGTDQFAEAAVKGEASDNSAPLTASAGASAHRTAGRLTHPGRYLEAYRQGHLAGALLEDVANLSVVGEAAGAGLNAVSRGAYARAATARTTAEAAEKAAIAAEGEAARSAATLSERTAATEKLASQLEDAVRQPGVNKATVQTAYDKAMAALRDADLAHADAIAGAEEARLRATTAAERADTLIGEAGRGYRAYRAARDVAHLGGQGAMAPMKPYAWAIKGLGKVARTFLERNPGLQLALDRWAEASDFRSLVHGKLQKVEADAADAAAAARRMERAGGQSALLEDVALLDHVGAGEAILDPTVIMGEGVQHGVEAAERMAEQVGHAFGHEPGAMTMVVRLARLREALRTGDTATIAALADEGVDQALLARVDEMRRIYRERMSQRVEQTQHGEGPGRRRNPAEEQRAFADYNVYGGAELPPGVEEGIRAKGEARLNRLNEDLADAEKRAAKARKKAGVGPKQAGVRPSARLDQLATEIGASEAEKRRPGALRDVQAAARAEGRLRLARSTQERIQALRESIPESVPDEAVARLAGAVERFQHAQERLDLIAGQAGEIVTPALRDEVGQMRRNAVDVAREELAASPDLPMSTIEFVPDDFSEYHQALHEALSPGASAREMRLKDRVTAAWEKMGKAARGRTTRREIAVIEYRKMWNKLPAQLKRAMRQMTDDQVRLMWDREATRGLDPAEVGGLDALANEFAPEGTPIEQAIPDLIDEYAHQHRLNEFVRDANKSTPRHRVGWSEAELADLSGDSRSSALGEMLRDPEIRAALAEGPMRDVAQAVLEARNARMASFVGGENFPLAEFARRVDEEPFPFDPQDAEAILVDVLGRDAADEIMSRWLRAGQPDITQAMFAMARGEIPDWMIDRPGALDETAGGWNVQRYEGTVGDNSHITMNEEGRLPPDALRRFEGAAGEARGEHRARQGADWEAFVDDVRQNGVREPIFVTVDHGSAPVISEGNHRLDAAIEAGVADVPVHVRYFGHAEQQTRLNPNVGEPATGALTAMDLGETPLTREQKIAQGEISKVVSEAGGQPARGKLGTLGGQLAGVERNAQATIENRAGAEGDLISGVAKRGAKEGVKAGKKLAKAEAAEAEVARVQRRIAAHDDVVSAAIDRAYRDITNAPARARPALAIAKQFKKAMLDFQAEIRAAAEEGDAPVDPQMIAALNDAVAASLRDVRDIYAPGQIALPDGTTVAAPPKFEPEFVPGGQPLHGEGEAPTPGVPTNRPLYAQKAQAERVKRGTSIPTSVAELKEVLRQRFTREARNDTVRAIQQRYGRNANGVIGDIENMTGEEVTAAMREHDYVPWDPESPFARVSAKDVHDGTIFIHERLFDELRYYFGEHGKFERFLRKYYDRPITWWKAAVLALRPAWHVNNVVGNAFMAMTAGGMDPFTYGRRVRQARSVLSLPEAELDVRYPETARTARRAANAPERLAKLRARVGTIEPGALEALGGTDNLVVPPEIMQRGSGAALGRMPEPTTRMGRLVDASYAANGFVDDTNRLAVFLETRSKLTEADLHNLVARNPELAGLTLDQIRTEGALRISLKTAGDFLRMSPFEQQVVRRIVPFYAWVRHITKLAYRMAVFHPLRTVWFLHLADLYGDPQDYGLANTFPIGPNGLLQFPNVNPYGDVTSVQPKELGFNLTPAAKAGAGLLFGLDLNRMEQFQRPPGQPGGYGGPPGQTPVLTRLTPYGIGPLKARLPVEALNLLAGQFPQTRVVRGITDRALEGGPVMRYPLGQIRRTAKTQGRQPIPSGEPALGALARYLGLPYTRRPNLYEQRQLRAQRRQKARAKG